MRSFCIIVVVYFLHVFNVKAQIEEKDGLYYKDCKVYSGTYEKNEDGSQVKMNILNGRPDGITMIYFSSGKPKEQRSYKEGKFDGLWITWNENGKKLAEANYHAGKKHGQWFIWDELGTKRYEMFYEEGVRKGKWTIWDETGKMISEITY